MFFYVLFYCPFRFSIKTNVKLAFNFVNSIPSSILCKLDEFFDIELVFILLRPYITSLTCSIHALKLHKDNIFHNHHQNT